MARRVDPERHAARRLQIIDAGLTVFAERGYDGATTAAICRVAGIGSGTFFHYFPRKLDLLLAILALGADETSQAADRHAGRDDAVGVLVEMVAATADDAADPRMPGFVRAVSAMMHEPSVAAALEADDTAQRDVLRPWVQRGQQAGQVRTDLPADRIVAWLNLLTGGFLERAAVEPTFDPAVERAVLAEVTEAFLRPA